LIIGKVKLRNNGDRSCGGELKVELLLFHLFLRTSLRGLSIWHSVPVAQHLGVIGRM
jgi:hypothetical protein